MIKLLELYCGILVLWIFFYKIGKILFDKENKKIELKVIICILTFAGLTTFINTVNFEMLRGIFKILCVYCLYCLFYKIIFKEDWSKIIIVALMLYLFICVSEIMVAILASIVLSITNQSIAKLKDTIFINLIVSYLAYTLVKIGKMHLKKISSNVSKNKISISIILIVLITMALLLFKIPIGQWRLNIEFLITMLISFGLCVIALYTLKQHSDIEKTTSMYQQVVKHSNMTNKLLEDYRIVSHEHKNQLSIIRQMIKDDNSELIEYIDNLLSKRQDIKHKWIADLNKVPLDGLKGLINYKLLEAEDCNIELIINISDELNRFKNRLNKLSTIQKDDLYSIVGVYLDNAIQAAKESKKKEISLEIFKENKDIVIIIANTYRGKIELEKIDSYGYTTKGKNHGVGLHIVRKILEDNYLYSQSRKIVDNYYVQELRIHTGELKNKKSKK